MFCPLKTFAASMALWNGDHALWVREVGANVFHKAPGMPCLMMVEPTNTGMNSSCAMALSNRPRGSPGWLLFAIEVFHHKVVIGFSNQSHSLSRATWACSRYSSGISSTRSESPSVGAFMRRISMTPFEMLCQRQWEWSPPKRAPKRACSAAMITSKFA